MNQETIGGPVRIVVASEEDTLRSSVAMLIDAQMDLELVGDANDFADLLTKAKAGQPDLIVLDWDAMGDRIELLFKLFEFIEETPPDIIALSVKEDARDEVLATGVSGFVHKGNPPTGLLDAIRQSDAGKHLL